MCATPLSEPAAREAGARQSNAADRSARGRWERHLARRGGSVEILRLPAALYRCASGLRGGLYDRRVLPRVRVGPTVISVGNLSVGGTGKTPFVISLARRLQERGLKPGILSRGYRAARSSEGRETNDEGRMLQLSLEDVPSVQDPDRVRGAQALERLGVDVVLLDDGFQHRRLERDLDLVLIDATRPWGLPAARVGESPVRALLPRGLLREHPKALARADALVITRCDQVDASALEQLAGELCDVWAPGRPILRARHRPSHLFDSRGRVSSLAQLDGLEVELLSAIGNPDAFEASVAGLGATIRRHHVFPDHHHFTSADVEGLAPDGRMLVTSAKDAVKLGPLGLDFKALAIEFELIEGQAVLHALLDSLPQSRARLERKNLHEGLHG